LKRSWQSGASDKENTEHSEITNRAASTFVDAASQQLGMGNFVRLTANAEHFIGEVKERMSTTARSMKSRAASLEAWRTGRRPFGTGIQFHTDRPRNAAGFGLAHGGELWSKSYCLVRRAHCALITLTERLAGASRMAVTTSSRVFKLSREKRLLLNCILAQIPSNHLQLEAQRFTLAKPMVMTADDEG
jgi:hypothetical protein